MPYFTPVVRQLNTRFSAAHLKKSRSLFAPGKRLSAAAKTLKIKPPKHADRWYDFLDALPASIHESILATIYQVLSRRKPADMSFDWQASAAWEVRIWETPPTDDTRGLVSILLRTPCPD